MLGFFAAKTVVEASSSNAAAMQVDILFGIVMIPTYIVSKTVLALVDIFLRASHQISMLVIDV